MYRIFSNLTFVNFSGKIRGNTVLIKNPGPQTTNKVNSPSLLEDSTLKDYPLTRTKSYVRKSAATSSTSTSQNNLIINDIIIDTMDDQVNTSIDEIAELS